MNKNNFYGEDTFPFKLKKYKEDNYNDAYNIAEFISKIQLPQGINRTSKFRSCSNDEYNFMINFVYKKNWLSLYTDFSVSVPVEKLSIIINDKTIFETNNNSFLTFPNMLPLMAMHILEYNLKIYIKTINSNPVLTYTEIKVTFKIRYIIITLEYWYIDNNILLNGIDSKDIVYKNNIWTLLNSLGYF